MACPWWPECTFSHCTGKAPRTKQRLSPRSSSQVELIEHSLAISQINIVLPVQLDGALATKGSIDKLVPWIKRYQLLRQQTQFQSAMKFPRLLLKPLLFINILLTSLSSLPGSVAKNQIWIAALLGLLLLTAACHMHSQQLKPSARATVIRTHAKPN